MTAPRRPWQRRHRHRWTRWEDLRNSADTLDVRHCEICGVRQVRAP